MGDEVVRLKTSPGLLRTLKEGKRPSSEEVREQRVSFVYGSLDSKSQMTRDQVRRLVESAE